MGDVPLFLGDVPWLVGQQQWEGLWAPVSFRWQTHLHTHGYTSGKRVQKKSIQFKCMGPAAPTEIYTFLSSHTYSHMYVLCTLCTIHTISHVPRGMLPERCVSSSGRGQVLLSRFIARHTCTHGHKPGEVVQKLNPSSYVHRCVNMRHLTMNMKCLSLQMLTICTTRAALS